MAKKKVYCVFDTETIGIDKKWIYDLGMVISTNRGKDILHRKRWIIKEVMEVPNIEKMAYYGSKMRTFYKGLPKIPFSQAKEEFNNILQKFKVDTIVAYNLQFDMAAIKETLELTNNGKKFLKQKMEYFDLWNAACDSIFQKRDFKKKAIENGWMSDAGNYRTNAQVCYQYITGDYQFVETHTALEDANIETRILQEVLKQKKKIVRNSIISHPWRKVQEVKEEKFDWYFVPKDGGAPVKINIKALTGER